MLTYSDFDAIAQDLINRHNTNGAKYGSNLYNLLEDGNVFAVQWVTGGVGGGNCWSNSGHYTLEAQPEPELDGLVALLEDLDLRLRDANQIMKLVEYGSYVDRAYYGNYEEISFKYIHMDRVYEKLVELGYAEPKPESPALSA